MAWVYPGGLGATDFQNIETAAGYQHSNYIYGAKLTLSAGTVTQMSIRAKDANSAADIALKYGLYDTSGNLIVQTTGTVPGSSYFDGYNWVDSATFSQSVSAGDYFVLVSAENNDVRYQGDSSGNGSFATEAYATAMASTETITDGGETGLLFGVRVDLTAGGDTTAPVLSSPTGTATGSSTATVGATTDEGNGTLYAVVTTSSTQPSVAQIKAGQDHTGAAAAWSGSQAISTTGAKTLNATGLSVTTAYYAHLVHTDAAANDSNRISSATFTTFQRAAPASDVSAGSWTASSGSDLFAMIDEATPSDADYIKTATAADVCTVALGSLSDPSASTGHQVNYRISGDGTSGMQVELLQGTTVIATWTHDPAPASPTTYSQTLSGTEADAITDYTALRLRFTEV